MANEKYDARVAPSVNPEIFFEYNESADEKGVIKRDGYQFSGSSANVAAALNKLGYNPLIIGLTGSQKESATTKDQINQLILAKLLEESKLAFTPIPVLTRSNMAFVPINGKGEAGVIGAKGEVIESLIAEGCEKIKQTSGQWAIATGVRVAEVPFVDALYQGAQVGYRTLTPKIELVLNTQKFKALLTSVDMMVMNAHEFRACGLKSPNELHKFGPKLVVVTLDKDGGEWSYKHESFSFTGKYNSVIYLEKIFSKVGAGDWFHAAFVAYCLDKKKNILDLTEGSIEDGLYFAARVAGKKLTMLGGANGPSKDDLLLT